MDRRIIIKLRNQNLRVLDWNVQSHQKPYVEQKIQIKDYKIGLIVNREIMITNRYALRLKGKEGGWGVGSGGWVAGGDNRGGYSFKLSEADVS